MAKTSKAKIAANNRNTAKAYDRLYPFVPKGRKAEIQAAADALGETLNEFIVRAIDERMSGLERSAPFVAPPGKWCTKDCKKRAEAIKAGSGDKAPWCGAYATELPEAGDNVEKCEECLRDSQP